MVITFKKPRKVEKETVDGSILAVYRPYDCGAKGRIYERIPGTDEYIISGYPADYPQLISEFQKAAQKARKEVK